MGDPEKQKGLDEEVMFEPCFMDRTFRWPEDFAILEQSSCGFVLIDFAKGKKKRPWANRAYLEMMGQTLDKLREFDMNKNNSDAIHKWEEDKWRTVQVEKKPCRFVRTLYPNNVPKTLCWNLLPLRVVHPFSLPGGDCAEGPMVEDTLCFCQVVQQKSLSPEEKEMRRSHELMNYAEVVGIVIDKATGIVDYANPQAKRSYGLSFSQTDEKTLDLGAILATCIFQNDVERDAIHKSLQELTLQSNPLQFECRKTPSAADSASAEQKGGDIWHRMVFVPCKNPETGKDGLFVNEYDISELKKVQSDLRAANMAQDALVASVSHELRSPLIGMIGLTDVLMEDANTSAFVRKNISIIRSCAWRLSLLVNDILDAASSKRNTLIVKRGAVRLPEALAEVEALVSPLLKRGVALRSHIPPDLPPLLGDCGRITQILMNLLQNAVKFTAKGEITVSACPTPDGDHVEVSVRDTGIGVPADKLKTVFQAFQQADSEIAREFGGTGLGLSLVRALVAVMWWPCSTVCRL